MLIKAYGQFWNPEIIEWGTTGNKNKTKLLGKVQFGKQTVTIDFWEAKAIYVLYENFKCIYVGKALETNLGSRIRSHRNDRLLGRWDMFSFFCVSTVNKTKRNTGEPGNRWISPGITISTLEALAILVADPALNRKREKFKDAHEAIQVSNINTKSDHEYLEEIMNKLSLLRHDIFKKNLMDKDLNAPKIIEKTISKKRRSSKTKKY
jgi:hypothetical protein